MSSQGYGTYPAERVCPRCGAEWTLLVDRQGRQGIRSGTCGPCRTEPARVARSAPEALAHGAKPGDWADEALCAQTDPEIFFPEKGGSTQDAKAICRRCPVLTECRAWALETGQEAGIWGGLSAYERMVLLGRRRPISGVVAS